MSEREEIAEQRRRAGEVLSECKEQIIRRWMEKIRLLTAEKGSQQFMAEPVLRQDAREFIDMLISRLAGKGPETDIAAFYDLILDGRAYNVRLADIALAPPQEAAIA